MAGWGWLSASSWRKEWRSNSGLVGPTPIGHVSALTAHLSRLHCAKRRRFLRRHFCLDRSAEVLEDQRLVVEKRRLPHANHVVLSRRHFAFLDGAGQGGECLLKSPLCAEEFNKIVRHRWEVPCVELLGDEIQHMRRQDRTR